MQHILLHEIGRTCDTISNEDWSAPYLGVIMHALFFLGELREEETLDTVLEVMRQNSEFSDFHFGDSTDEILPLTLYYIGRNRLPQLLDYVKEPGLEVYFRTYVFFAPVYIVKHEPARREEVIEWFRDVLRFYIDNITRSEVYDATLVGMMMSQLIDMKATELISEIEELYKTKLVDETCCGNYYTVVEELCSQQSFCSTDYSLKDIYKRYNEYNEKWGGVGI